ncbi:MULTISPECIES: SCO2322 family protein [Streptomyces]|uniref:SCO2322 family protein n=1 Tax=Streptomyces solicathayae TaxID=3081768 RepID=A0ABZ0LYL9_9ACTN|nr:SCO2322 family protein [Streptomyces sp. HUAS YS2]WOX24622.1 SCO2322 family protein [Streptomyces sp. HUAS YS2]
MRGRLGAAVTAVLLTLLAAAPAQAAGYRYWSFWDGAAGKWAYATQGPATARPADGDVNGFRFALSVDSADAARPRTAPDFAKVCADTPPKAGTKRVAVVIDFGTPEDAADGGTPPEQRTGCARIGPDGTSAEALAAVAKPLRYNSAALLCGISGYPRTGCGEQVEVPAKTAGKPTSKPSAAGKDADSGPSVGVVAGGAAVLALGAAGLWQARRRRG